MTVQQFYIAKHKKEGAPHMTRRNNMRCPFYKKKSKNTKAASAKQKLCNPVSLFVCRPVLLEEKKVFEISLLEKWIRESFRANGGDR
jgi:hypothetical protein